MTRNKVLPSELTLRQIEEELGIDVLLDIAETHKELCHYINNEDFRLYFLNQNYELVDPKKIKSTGMSAKLKSKSKPINTTSDELIVKEISFEKYPMSLFDIGYSEAKKNNFKEFTVTKVSTCNSEEYNIIDGTSLGVKIHFDDLYGKRDEIFEYKRKNLNSDLLLEKTAPVSSKLKTQSKLDQRLNFFKLWLIGSSGGSIHNEDDLQKRYENMGSPTRGKIWLALQSADNKLFGSGKDDFLKAMANIISLKGGTGKHR